MVDADIEAVLAEMRATMAEIQGETAAVAAQLAEDRRADADKQAEVDQQRRNGEHGPEWRAVQQSIDMNKTTLADVIRGIDHSPEAVALRTMMAATLPAARSQFATIVEASEESGALAELQKAQAALAASLERVNSLNLNS